METIVLTGWKPGLNKVLLNKLLRDKSGMSLREAKTAVDRLLEGQEVFVCFEDAEAARQFSDEAARLGAEYRVAARDEVISHTRE